ncbi:MAG: undecaprenyl-diphosphate phosphatase [Treponema sp.]
MTISQAILFGTIQGLTEFLPISSSGHLAVAEYFLGHHNIPIIFDISLHLATLVAVCIVFYKTIKRLTCTLWRFIIGKHTRTDRDDLNLVLSLLISTITTGIIGFILRGVVQAKNIPIISICFIITGILLISAKYIQPKKLIKTPNFLHALIIGIMQGIAVLPGISRSGTTISIALTLGLHRDKAGEYSFLLSIPVIIAAFIFELKSADTKMSTTIEMLPLLAGIISAFIIGLFALLFFMKLIKKGRLSIFAYYLIPVGSILFAAVHWLHF